MTTKTNDRFQSSSLTVADTVDRVIRDRKTAKLLADPEARAERALLWSEQHTNQLQTMIESAAHAPYHRRVDPGVVQSLTLDSPVPWRFHILDSQAVSQLLDHLRTQSETASDPIWKKAWATKIPNLLAACGALVQVTWFAESANEDENPVLDRINIEHVAAASAATQNLLLCTEARGWHSYWSSGGVLGSGSIFEYLGISAKERLLGSIFLTPGNFPATDIKSGALRDQRGPANTWSRQVHLE